MTSTAQVRVVGSIQSLLLVLLTAQALLGQPLPSGSAPAVAVDPSSPNTLYAAAGVGVFKSTNGGQSWSNTGLPSTSSVVNGLVLDPSNPAAVYVAGNNGVYRSADGGQNWTFPGGNPGCALSVAVVPTIPTTVYAGACGWGIYKSTNGGQSFVAGSSDLAGQVVRSIAVDPTTSSTLYAGTNNGIYKSANAGQSWSLMSSGVSGFVQTLAVDAAHPTTVWAGTNSGLFKTTNAGQSWSGVIAGLPSYGAVVAIAYDPFTHSIMYAGTNAGVYKSADSGQSWSASNSGLRIGYVNGIAADPVNACVLYASTAFDTVYRTVNCGASWFAANAGVEGLQVSAVAVDPGNASTLYIGTGSGLYKSMNGGSDWSNSGPPGAGWVGSITIDPSTPATLYGSGNKTTNGGQSWISIGAFSNLAMDPSNPSVLYAPGYGSVSKTTNAGQLWTSYSSGLPANSIMALAVDPATPSNVYAGIYGAGVYKSIDGGQHWAATNTGLNSIYTPPAYYVQVLAFDRNVPANLYAGLLNTGLFKSSNGAQSWSYVSGMYSMTALAFDLSNANTFYVSSFGGISKTTNGGETWTAQNTGLPFLYVQSLSIDPSNPSTLYAGVFGGLYKSVNSAATWQQVGTASTSGAIIQPAQGTNTQSIPFVLSGIQRVNEAHVKLSSPAAPDIAATNTASPNASVLTGTFNLSGATTGARNVVITAADGSVVTLYNAFTIVAGPTCAYTVGPQSSSFGAGGGIGRVVVSAPSTCGWSFSADAAWITFPDQSARVPPSLNPVLSFAVAPNSGVSQRTGTITVANQNVTVTQTGLATCTYSIAPGSQIFAPGGGPASISVMAPAGCSWTAVSNVPWVSIVPPTGSGTGSRLVSISATSNPGDSRSGTLTVAGKTFNVMQAAAPASACGAVDVTDKIAVSRTAFTGVGPLFNYDSQRITLRNTSGQTVPGPIYMILDGLPRFNSTDCRYGCGISPAPPLTHCQSPSGSSLFLFVPGGLAPGQPVTLTPLFYPGTSRNTSNLQYTTRVFSGTPNQ